LYKKLTKGFGKSTLSHMILPILFCWSLQDI